MTQAIKTEIAGLARLSTKSLRERYAAVFGETTSSGNRPWLVKRIAWRMQANAEGDLSSRARLRAGELANDSDLRMNAPQSTMNAPTGSVHVLPTTSLTDRRLPPAGTVLVRKYRGTEIRVTVLDGGFEYAGTVYSSLSAAAKAITGSHCNGFAFFNLTKEGKR